MAQDDQMFLLALNRISFLKPKEKLMLAQIFELSAFFSLHLRELEEILGRRIKSRSWSPTEILKMAEVDRKHLTERGINCTFYWDKAFPPQLREIYDPPVLLFYRGRLPDCFKPTVAVVGTRRPAGAARSHAYSMGFNLAEMGISIVSGLARGIDSEAHRGCLDAGGRTTAVLGNGIDSIFPRSSIVVGRRILSQGGAIVSEYPPGVPPLPYNFPARNRIISGLARSVLVIQAPERSGALITADYALEQGRDLFIHTVGLDGTVGRGTRKLYEEGAPRVDCAEDILKSWGWVLHKEVQRAMLKYKRLSEMDEMDRITQRGGTGSAARLARLMELELSGIYSRNNGDQYLTKRHS